MIIPILIPAYKPDIKLLTMVTELTQKTANPIFIVNDGNPINLPLFKQIEKLGATVIHHTINLGKGRAIKTGLNAIVLKYPDAYGCVTCDADGQHSVVDILRLIKELQERKNFLILGCRTFDKNTPLRSRLGNNITKYVFKFAVGLKISDTQTGLRGIPASLLKNCIVVSGERYEYETNILLYCKQNNIKIEEIRIQTIYIDKNRESHFNPIIDSMKIYFLLIRFTFSGLISSLIDFLIFSISFAISSKLLFSLIIARILSVILNFTINKNIVFKSTGNHIVFLIKYGLLAISLLTCSYYGIKFVSNTFHIPVYFAKILIETILFFASFTIQRDYIFKRNNLNNV